MADALPPPAAPARGRSILPKVLIAIAVLAAIVAILLITDVIGGGDDKEAGDDAAAPSVEQVAQELREGRILAGRPDAPFAMRYTNDWTQMTSDQLRGGPGRPPIAGLRRTDRSGLLTVTLGGPVRRGIRSLQESLPAELARRYDDFSLETIERIRVAAGPALYTSWTRTRTGQVQSQLVVPVSNQRSFTVDVVLRGDAQEAAVEAGAMLRTFDTAPAR